MVRSIEDLQRAKSEKKLGFILGLQNAKPIGKDLLKLRILAEVGIKIIGLIYQYSNDIGDGVAEPANGGLSTFDMAVIEEMNQLGIIVDLSHVGEQTSLDAIEMAKAPPVFSHSNVRAIVDHPRNCTDE